MAAPEKNSSNVLFALRPSVTLIVIHSAELNTRPGKLATHQMEVGVGVDEGEAVGVVDAVGETTMAEINLGRVAIHLTRPLCRTLVGTPGV